MTSATTTDLETFGLFIHGESVQSLSGTTFQSQNPYLGRPWAQLADGAPADIDLAVASSRAAFEGEWGQLTGFARAAIMRNIGDAITAHAERLALLEVNDSGKLLREMRGQLNVVLRFGFVGNGFHDLLLALLELAQLGRVGEAPA